MLTFGIGIQESPETQRSGTLGRGIPSWLADSTGLVVPFWCDMSREIPLTQDKVALVDDADFEWLSQWKWYACRNPSGIFYAMRNTPRDGGGQHTLRMHRVILAPPAGIQVDHINMDGLDNRRANIRTCTASQNQYNKLNHGKTSQYKGVDFHKKSGLWRMRITLPDRSKIRNFYPNELAAATAYDELAREHHGEFARLNLADGRL